MRLLFVLVLVMLGFADVQAQTDTITYVHKSVGVEIPGVNEISNPAGLDLFFEKLFLLHRDRDRVLNIVHFGDSHVQADYMTAIVRRNLQKHFGTAGRGLLVPFTVAGTNGPVNFVSTSNTKWEVKRAVQTSLPEDVGIGGITITTTASQFDLSFAMNDLWTEQLISKATVYLKTSNNINLQALDEAGKSLTSAAADSSTRMLELDLPRPVSQLSLSGVVAGSGQKRLSIFGVNVSNGHNGLLYHTAGVNGARYQHFNKAKLLAEQVFTLNPDLVIISLGTNESMEKVDERILANEIKKMVETLQKDNPGTMVLLVTPPDCLVKGKANPNIAAVRNQIIRYAVDHGLAFYDFNKIMGGKGSAFKWRSRGMMRPDGVHFTKEAYEYIGSMLFEAIVKHYNKHVSLRHP